MHSPNRISVIITTYNSPAALEKVLLGYALQTDRNFEVVVADDGSDQQTAELIKQFRASSDLRISHVWHQDNGFRKCEILNRAIEASTGDYLVFTDGDCIPRADFVEVHRQEAEPGRFLSGTYNTVPESFGELISNEAIESGHAFELTWLRRTACRGRGSACD